MQGEQTGFHPCIMPEQHMFYLLHQRCDYAAWVLISLCLLAALLHRARRCSRTRCGRRSGLMRTPGSLKAARLAARHSVRCGERRSLQQVEAVATKSEVPSARRMPSSPRVRALRPGRAASEAAETLKVNGAGASPTPALERLIALRPFSPRRASVRS